MALRVLGFLGKLNEVKVVPVWHNFLMCGRYRLSRTSADRAADRVDYQEYQRKQPKPGKGFGTLGDLLRAKLQEQEESDEE